MFCLPLQGFARHWSEDIQTGDRSFAHGVLHDEHVSHHHEADGSIHFDASDESVQHVQDHSCSPQPTGLLLPAVAAAPDQLVEIVSARVIAYIPDPMLELPHRPPALALG
ncbi:hypothetical protein ASE26_05070 [Duganella sp. Root198D2]|nr:hypothetical protein ASE26_05070 [Duganella sp. Root198D2]